MVSDLDARFNDCLFPYHVCGLIATGYEFTEISRNLPVILRVKFCDPSEDKK